MMPRSSSSPLQLHLDHQSPNFCRATIVVPAAFVDGVYMEVVKSQSVTLQAHGFYQIDVPIEQIEQNFRTNLIDHVKEFLFKYFVLNFLYKEMRTQKILFVGEPRLISIELGPSEDARYQFDLSIFSPIQLHEWKYFPFKAPKRKNYKDLDRQVETFIEEEQTAKQANKEFAEMGDWVNFDVLLVDRQNQPIFDDQAQSLWLKIGDEEADESGQELLMGKRIGDTFVATSSCLQEYFSNQIDTAYSFSVTIKDIIKNSYFCLDSFREYFRLKTKKEMYQKLIEVFSYRNDLSQRRAMVEDALALVLAKHQFEVPNHLVLRQQKVVLESVQNNPDYHVYRMQKDFQEKVQALALKQIRESVIIDQLAYNEGMTISMHDIKNYLNLTNRPRTKEFIYFEPPLTCIKNQETPMSTEFLKQSCLREKMLNYLIYHLTK
jgi:FKBP-type peptidyl-prolyl cis-trans isomerase (trigger factor)